MDFVHRVSPLAKGEFPFYNPAMALKWVFLDMGSVIVDEVALRQQRVDATAATSGGRVSPKLLFERMKYYASLNEKPYQRACEELGLPKLPWRSDLGLETLRPNVEATLKILKFHYRIGLIANQPLGTADRLKGFGIRDYFEVIVASAEEKLEKPDPRIFKLGLTRAGVAPEEALMCGDRLDNDILPSMKLGIRTAWVKYDMGSYGNVDLLPHEPDFTISNIDELPYLLGICASKHNCKDCK
jgi:HAD superfamily hydrolase (TIGR01549 family)